MGSEEREKMTGSSGGNEDLSPAATRSEAQSSPGMTDGQLPLATWLDEVARGLGGYASGAEMVADTGVCCWMDYYNDGYSPAATVVEECSYD